MTGHVILQNLHAWFLFSFIDSGWACSVSVVVRMQDWNAIASGCRFNPWSSSLQKIQNLVETIKMLLT